MLESRGGILLISQKKSSPSPGELPYSSSQGAAPHGSNAIMEVERRNNNEEEDEYDEEYNAQIQDETDHFHDEPGSSNPATQIVKQVRLFWITHSLSLSQNGKNIINDGIEQAETVDEVEYGSSEDDLNRPEGER